ncbi:MAG: hypothetical protein ABJB47_21225 [Actinomycetota bacterium]
MIDPSRARRIFAGTAASVFAVTVAAGMAAGPAMATMSGALGAVPAVAAAGAAHAPARRSSVALLSLQTTRSSIRAGVRCFAVTPRGTLRPSCFNRV